MLCPRSWSQKVKCGENSDSWGLQVEGRCDSEDNMEGIWGAGTMLYPYLWSWYKWLQMSKSVGLHITEKNNSRSQCIPVDLTFITISFFIRRWQPVTNSVHDKVSRRGACEACGCKDDLGRGSDTGQGSVTERHGVLCDWCPAIWSRKKHGP